LLAGYFSLLCCDDVSLNFYSDFKKKDEFPGCDYNGFRSFSDSLESYPGGSESKKEEKSGRFINTR
jgi:hypothetical protein